MTDTTVLSGTDTPILRDKKQPSELIGYVLALALLLESMVTLNY